MMAIDALELSIEMRPDVVILVAGDADFAYLATKLRRHGIRVEVASVAARLRHILRSAAKDVIDLAGLFRTFEITTTRPRGTRANKQPGRLSDRGMREWQTFRIRRRRHRNIERINNADAGHGFVRNKVEVVFRSPTSVNVEVIEGLT